MEEIKKESTNKPKRLKADRIKQITSSYLRKRNYGNGNPEEYPWDEFVRYTGALGKVSQPKILFFACWNNKEALVIDNNYCKFINWLKEIKTKVGHTDLENLTAPLFCYMYLELLKKGLLDQAAAFFAAYNNSLNPLSCDNNIAELIAGITSNGFDDLNGLKDTFRSNKYTIRLSPAACTLLKKFLSQCHIVFLQMLSLWFQVEEIDDEEDEEEKRQEAGVALSVVDKVRKKFEKATACARKMVGDMCRVQICDARNNITCGLIDKYNGTVVYCDSNSTHIRSIGTLRSFLKRERCKEIVIRNHTGPIYDIGIVKKYHLLATASYDKNVFLYDLNNHRKHSILKGHTYPVYSLSSSNDGGYLVTGSSDATIRLWSLQRNSTVRMYVGHKQEITALDFHQNSLYFASSSVDKAIRMWTISIPTPVRLLYGSEGPIYCVKFSPNGRLIACGGEDKLRIWDLTSSKQLLEIKCGKEPVTQLCWSLDQNSITTGSTDGVVRKWNLSRLLANPAEAKHCQPISSVQLHSKILRIEYSDELLNCLSVQNEVPMLIKS